MCKSKNDKTEKIMYHLLMTAVGCAVVLFFAIAIAIVSLSLPVCVCVCVCVLILVVSFPVVVSSQTAS